MRDERGLDVTRVTKGDLHEIGSFVDLARYRLQSRSAQYDRLVRSTRDRLQVDGACTLDGFLTREALTQLLAEVESCIGKVHFSRTSSTIYLRPGDPALEIGHPRRREAITHLGVLADDQIPEHSLLKCLYRSPDFRGFVAAAVGVPYLYSYQDPLTSVNVLVFQAGHELGWHFDEAEYAVTLLLQKPEVGGVFEFAGGLRSNETEDETAIRRVLNGETCNVVPCEMKPGTLMLFRGRHALHRVTRVEGLLPRILAVFSFDTVPGVALSETDRLLFYGRAR